jgi:selenocysteine-specific elongation factor
LIQQGILGKNKEIIFLTEFKYLNSEEKEKLKKELEEKFLSEGYTPRDFETILLDFKENYKAAKELAQALLKEGVLVKLTDKLVFHAKILEEWENLVRTAFQKKKELELADFKNLTPTQVSRKFLIPLVEYLDKKKVTLRVGDKRILRKT